MLNSVVYITSGLHHHNLNVVFSVVKWIRKISQVKKEIINYGKLISSQKHSRHTKIFEDFWFKVVNVHLWWAIHKKSNSHKKPNSLLLFAFVINLYVIACSAMGWFVFAPKPILNHHLSLSISLSSCVCFYVSYINMPSPDFFLRHLRLKLCFR